LCMGLFVALATCNLVHALHVSVCLFVAPWPVCVWLCVYLCVLGDRYLVRRLSDLCECSMFLFVHLQCAFTVPKVDVTQLAGANHAMVVHHPRSSEQLVR
jgi:hypothetical protein